MCVRTEDDVDVNSPEVGWEVVCYITGDKSWGENALMGV